MTNVRILTSLRLSKMPMSHCVLGLLLMKTTLMMEPMMRTLLKMLRHFSPRSCPFQRKYLAARGCFQTTSRLLTGFARWIMVFLSLPFAPFVHSHMDVLPQLIGDSQTHSKTTSWPWIAHMTIWIVRPRETKPVSSAQTMCMPSQHQVRSWWRNRRSCPRSVTLSSSESNH